MMFYYQGNALYISLKIPKRLDTVIYPNTFEWLLLKIPYNPGQNIWNKIEDPVKLQRKRKTWYLLLRVYWLLLPNFNIWKRHWAVGYVSTQIKYFPDISLFPKIPSLKSFGNSWGSSYVKFAKLDITFYLWLIGSVLKHCKVPKYYDQDCRKQKYAQGWRRKIQQNCSIWYHWMSLWLAWDIFSKSMTEFVFIETSGFYYIAWRSLWQRLSVF